LSYTWAHPDLVLAMGLAFVIGTFGFNYQVTIALMAREQFGIGAEAFGLLSTAFAVGSLSGALLSTRRSVRPRQRFLVVSAVVAGIGAGAWLARGRRVRLEAHVAPPRLALHVGRPVGAVPSAPLRAAEEAAAAPAPGAPIGGG